jgi:hypothetical protein
LVILAKIKVKSIGAKIRIEQLKEWVDVGTVGLENRHKEDNEKPFKL